MQSTFVRLNAAHREILQRQATAEGCSLSDLIRRAVIVQYKLPTGKEA
ncbi:MAG: hypothetical protein ACREXY_17730 [Gammaproteobacteria bacterium]